MAKVETKEIPTAAKATVFALIGQAANKSPEVNAYIRGLADALELTGSWTFDYRTFSFKKQEPECPVTEPQPPTGL